MKGLNRLSKEEMLKIEGGNMWDWGIRFAEIGFIACGTKCSLAGGLLGVGAGYLLAE